MTIKSIRLVQMEQAVTISTGWPVAKPLSKYLRRRGPVRPIFLTWTHIAVAIALIGPISSPFNLAIADTFGSGANQFTIDFVTIGDSHNPADTTGKPNPAGSVDYAYRIGNYEVSRDMVTKANAEGNLGVGLYGFGRDIIGGFRPAMPAGDTIFNEVARFANWLNTSQGFPAAYNFSTQPGDDSYNANENLIDWQISDPGFDPSNPVRNSLAHYFLPSEDEWYKAAYYDPGANDGMGGYWDYATASDLEPTPVASGTSVGTAVYLQPLEQGPADVTQAGGLSPYGVMGMGGNINEWTESLQVFPAWRISRGGGHTSSASGISSSVALQEPSNGSGNKNFATGFRVASIASLPIRGDFNEDGQLNAPDINDLTLQSASRTHPSQYDLTNDGLVNDADVTFWAHELFGTWIGDANLDGEFNTGDLVDVFKEGVYEDAIPLNADWTKGDWDGDGDFITTDLVTAFFDGGYEQGSRDAANAVPEPASFVMLVAGLFGVAVRRRHVRPCGHAIRSEFSRKAL